MSEPANEPQDEPQDRSTQYVDWAFAKTTGRRLVNPGPKVSAADASFARTCDRSSTNAESSVAGSGWRSRHTA